MRRTTIFFLAACCVGLWILHARYTHSELEYGGPGRYRNRGDNTEAWKPYEAYTAPSPRSVLKYICRGLCPDSTFPHILLPTDNIRHLLVTFRDPDAEHSRDPIRSFEDVIRQEEGIQIGGRLDDRSTLKDLVVLWNRLRAERRKEIDSISTADSAARERFRRPYQQYLDQLEQRRRDSLAKQAQGAGK